MKSVTSTRPSVGRTGNEVSFLMDLGYLFSFSFEWKFLRLFCFIFKAVVSSLRFQVGFCSIRVFALVRFQGGGFIVPFFRAIFVQLHRGNFLSQSF